MSLELRQMEDQANAALLDMGLQAGPDLVHKAIAANALAMERSLPNAGVEAEAIARIIMFSAMYGLGKMCQLVDTEIKRPKP